MIVVETETESVVKAEGVAADVGCALSVLVVSRAGREYLRAPREDGGGVPAPRERRVRRAAARQRHLHTNPSAACRLAPTERTQ